MATETYIYDGTKVTDLNKVIYGNEGGAEVSVIEAFKSVPWLHRAILLRSDAVSGMPWSLTRADSNRGDTDVSASDEFKRITNDLANLLWQTEASLIVSAAAYWILSANRMGKNLTPRWVLSDTIEPQTDEAKGVTGFIRNVNGNKTPVPLDRMVYWWKPSLESELAPGEPEAAVAIRAAGVLLNTDRMIESYFKRGAIKVTLLTVEGNPPKEELDRLEHWWKRMITGVKRAYESIAIRAAVKPTVIGSDLKETDAKELTNQKREDIAVALGVPQSLLFQSSAYATARHEDQLIFLERTVIPECTRIAETLNKQWLVREGVTLTFHPERLPIMQDALIARAEAVFKLTGLPVLSVQEGRAMLGLPDIQTTPTPTGSESSAGLADGEMKTWQRFAIKRAKEGRPDKAKEFKCEYVPAVRAAAIAGALDGARTIEDVQRAFAWAEYP
jgi:hypothetical protein